MNRVGTAYWVGGIEDGTGSISTQSGALSNATFGFNTRFEDEPGTNPEELIAAAHAGCFAMALSHALGQAGFRAERIDSRAVVSLAKKDDGFAITKSDLTVTASVPDANDDAFEKAVEAAKAGCPVSNALKTDVVVRVSRS